MKSIEILRPRVRTIPVADFATSPVRRRRSRACDVYDCSTLHFLLDCGYFVRLVLLPRRALWFDYRNQGIAAFHAFLRWDIGGTRAVGDRTLRGITLNTDPIFHALGAAVPDSARELLVVPLDFQL